ncbi:MAG: lamin tail domain-containing protein [Bacteroidota bacterium]
MKNRSCILLAFILLASITGFSQLTDDFSDGDFTANPVWSGDNPLFRVNESFQLQSNGQSISETIYLSTPQSLATNVEWLIDINMSFAPSGSNKARVYLVSNQADLSGPLNGYFIEIGESGSSDGINLYRQDGLDEEELIDGSEVIAGGGLDATVRVSRDGEGNWEIQARENGATSFVSQGTATDNSYTQTTFFGVFVRHTASRRDDFTFDNVAVNALITDATPPEPQEVIVESGNTLSIRFSEPLQASSAESATNYTINNGIGTPASASLNVANTSEVQLQLASPLQSGTNYEISIDNVRDLAGNAMSTSVVLPFSFFQPDVAEFKDLIISELLPDPNPSVGLPEGEFVELFNRSEKTLDLNEYTLSNGTTVAELPTYILGPGEYIILSSTANSGAYETFGDVLGLSPFPALSNNGDEIGLRDNVGTLLDSVEYLRSWYGDTDKDDGGFSLELINPDKLTCAPISNWLASNASLGGTPASQNSVFDQTPDDTAPSLVSVSLLDATSARVCFNEPMDEGSLNTIANYSIDNGVGNPSSAEAEGPDFLCAIITFPALDTGVVYSLTISSLSDCSGNIMSGSESRELVIGKEGQPFDIVINEIFSDPEPSFGLPAGEFVELYNRSNTAISLNGWTLSDASRSTTLGAFTLTPGAYVIVVDEDFVSDYQTFGAVLGVPSLPDLGISQDEVSIIDASGVLIDQLRYERSWYRDADKDDGGFSLERIDPDFVNCNNSLNWIASNASIGGTPGTVNSAAGDFIDVDAPSVVSLEIVDSVTLRLFFSEPMDLVSLDNPLAYEVNQGIGNPLAISVSEELPDQVVLLFDQGLQDQITYELQINGITDCAGNELTVTELLGLPSLPQAGDILINEILFNPLEGGSDFVEIYNASNKVIDLRDVTIGRLDPENGSLLDEDPITDQSFLFLPGRLLCVTKDVAAQQQAYSPPVGARFIEAIALPSFPSSEGGVAILVNDSVSPPLDVFIYADDLHFPTLEDDKGVSLERISLRRSAADPNNWHSAARTVNFATPGYENSQQLDTGIGDEEVFLTKEVFSPNGDGTDDVLAINYNFNFTGANARAHIFDPNGRKIRILQQNFLPGTTEGTLFWDGRDEDNQKAAIGMYAIVFEVTRQDTGEKKLYKVVGVLADNL